MQGLLFPGNREVQLSSFPDPTAGPGEVVVAMRAAAICGSDLHAYRAPREQRPPDGRGGIIPGHEPSGVVHTVGDGVTGIKVSDRVAVYHYRGCGNCGECRAGRLMWCPERRGYGGTIHGADADLIVTDARNCLPLPDDFSFATGALLTCIAGTAYEAMRKLDASGRATIAIFGLGPVGLAGVLMARAMGAEVVGIDVSPARLSLALRLGASAIVDAGNEDVVTALRRWACDDGVSASLETSGSASGQSAAVEATGRGGRVAFVGFGASGPTLSPAGFIQKQLTLMGSFVFPIGAYEEIVSFVRRHDVPLEALITHRVPLRAAAEIFPDCDRGQTGKVVFSWEEE